MVVKILTGLVAILAIALAVVTVVYSNNACNKVEATASQEGVTANRYAVLTQSLQTEIRQLDDMSETEFERMISEYFSGNTLSIDSTDKIVLEDGWDWLTSRRDLHQERCGRKCYSLFFEQVVPSMSGGESISFEGNLDLDTNNLSGTLTDHWNYSSGSFGSNIATISAQVLPVQSP